MPRLREIDITTQDLKNSSSTWHGPVFLHWHTAEELQAVLDRHGLDLLIGLCDDDRTRTYIDVVPKPEHVESSMLDEIAYDETTKKLTIKFNHGSAYEYYDVELAIFNGLKEAESIGKFFHKHIKSQYRCKQIE